MSHSPADHTAFAQLMATIEDRKANPPERSYTTTLFQGGVEKIGGKILEEAQEMVDAARETGDEGRQHLIYETADLIYHMFVMLGQQGIKLEEVEAELSRRFGTSGLDEKAARAERQCEMSNLRLGLPSKGRLAEQAAELLGQAGLKFRRQDRSLFARVSQFPVDITFLRTDDIPVLCAEGAIDMGITGSDLLDEAGVDLTTRLALGIGKCRLSVCVPEDSAVQSPADLKGCRVATSFPHVTQKFFQQHQADVHLVPLSGSVEIMISLGVAEGIVDLVETGSTLAANRLRILTDIGQYETILVQNSRARHADVADRIVRRLEGVVIARAWSLLEYNIPRAKLSDAEAITPGFNSPTVNALEDSAWCAVQVMVKRKQVIDVMDKLEALGATAILETEITNCRL